LQVSGIPCRAADLLIQMFPHTSSITQLLCASINIFSNGPDRFCL
jgi:hypothetical protein